MNPPGKFAIITLFLIFGIIILSQNAEAQNWLSGWLYRIPINISNSGSSALTDYQVLITLNTATLISAGKMRSDCGDIRFTDSDGTTLLNYWIESGCNSANTKIWVKVPNIPASSTKTIYVYYGNPSATSLSNGTATFIFFDNAETDYGHWEAIQEKWHRESGIDCRYEGSYGWAYSNGCLGGYSNYENYILQSKSFNLPQAKVSFYTRGSTEGGYDYLYFEISYNGGSTWSTLWSKSGSWGWEFVELTTSSSTNAKIRFRFYSDGTNIYSGAVFDRLLIRKYVSPEPTISLGNEQSIFITIYSPQNTTYFHSQNFEFKFKAESFVQAFELKAFLDSNEIYSNSNYQNGTNTTLLVNLTQDKTYNFTIWANANNVIRTQSVIFTIKAYEFVNVSFQQFAYETSNQTFAIVFRVNYDLVENIASTLVWNGTTITQQSQAKNSTHIVNNFLYDIPLVQTNNTQISFYFSNVIYYKNGTQTTFTTNNYQQNITFAYIPTAQTYPLNAIEYDLFNVSFNPICYENKATLASVAFFVNQTNTMQQTTYCKFLTTFIAPEPSSYNQTHALNISFVISFKNQTITRTTQNFNITIFRVTLTDCSIFPTQTFSLIVRDEETQNTLSSLNYTFLRFDVTPLNNKITRTYTFENRQTICIYPSWARYQAKIYAVVRRDNYALTTHAPYTTSILSNQTQTLTLYMLPLSYATPITFTLPNQNYILYVEKGYGSNFVYVRSDTADFNKKVVVYLRPYDIFYKVKVFTPEQTLCFQSDQFKVASSSYEILSCQAGLTNYTIQPLYQKIISGNCSSYDIGNYTRVLCSFVTLDNLDHDVELKVYQLVEPFGEVIYYENSTRGATGSFDFLLPKGYDYKVVMSAHSVYDYISLIIQTKQLIKSAEIFFFALLLFIVSAVIGFINPLAGLVMNVLLLFGLSATGTLSLQSGIIGAITLLIIVAIIFTREWR